ncbi:MAG: ATP-binding protein [Acidobacteria bacterium]|nr:ATP-binding protein [Acidobacteriota bacterium]
MKEKPDESMLNLFSEYFRRACPRCGDSGWIIENGVSRRCDCFREAEKTRRPERAHIPPSYLHCLLENFRPPKEENPQSDSIMKALTHAKSFAKHYDRYFGRGILFRGPVGVGKTHLAVGILQELLNQGLNGYFFNFIHLIEKIKQSYDPERDVYEPEFFRQLERCTVVVMDELGATKPSEFVFNKLYDIVNFCFDRKISMIFTTNYLDAVEPVAARSAENGSLEGSSLLRNRPPFSSPQVYTLAERITDRLLSRIIERCDDVVMDGPDYRKTKGRIPKRN